MRLALDLQPGPVVLSIRSPTPLYNINLLVAAIPTILEHIPTAQFVLRDYNGDARYIGQLKQQIIELGITKAVYWLGQQEPWERNVDTYRLADVAISIPSSDSTPVSVLEAMACGTALVVTDLPALREWITPGVEGLLVAPGDVPALAHAIITLLNDPNQRALMGRRNREVVASRQPR